MMWFARCSRARTLPLLLALSFAAGPALAVDLDFDGLESLSDVANATLPGVSVSTALVLSETDLETLAPGLATPGTFATSGSQGLLNTLASSITFTFDVPVTSFSIDILSLASDGVTLPIVLRGFGDTPGSVTSDILLIGDSGFHEQRLSLSGLFSSVELSAFESTKTTTFWLDTASFTPVPEPGSLSLLGSGLAVLASFVRGRGRRS